MQAVQNSLFGSSVLYSSSSNHLPADSSNVTDGLPMFPSPSIHPGRNAKAEECGTMPPNVTPSSWNKSAIEHDTAVSPPNKSCLLRTNSAYYGYPINESDDDFVELVKGVNKFERPRESPSPRERRLNIRDVDENETSGGALFTVEERKMLGISPSKVISRLSADLSQILSS